MPSLLSTLMIYYIIILLSKNCLIHALARTYAHFFTSILYVNFQFGSNEYSDYLALLLPSSSLLRKGDLLL